MCEEKKIKCQVGEKYLSTGEEKCCTAILTVYEIDIGQGNQNKEVIDIQSVARTSVVLSYMCSSIQ